MKKLFILIVLVIVAFLFNVGAVQAKQKHTNEMDSTMCFDCHGNKTFKATINNQVVSLYVDKTAYKNSVHGKSQCVSCHDFSKPYEPGESLNAATLSATCGKCHYEEAEAYNSSVHAADENGASCADCHGNAHNIVSGATISLKDAHGDFMDALREAYKNKVEIKLP